MEILLFLYIHIGLLIVSLLCLKSYKYIIGKNADENIPSIALLRYDGRYRCNTW